MGRGAPEAGRQLLHRQPLGVADPWHRFGDDRQHEDALVQRAVVPDMPDHDRRCVALGACQEYGGAGNTGDARLGDPRHEGVDRHRLFLQPRKHRRGPEMPDVHDTIDERSQHQRHIATLRHCRQVRREEAGIHDDESAGNGACGGKAPAPDLAHRNEQERRGDQHRRRNGDPISGCQIVGFAETNRQPQRHQSPHPVDRADIDFTLNKPYSRLFSWSEATSLEPPAMQRSFWWFSLATCVVSVFSAQCALAETTNHRAAIANGDSRAASPDTRRQVRAPPIGAPTRRAMREQVNSGLVGIIFGGMDDGDLGDATDLVATVESGNLKILPVAGDGAKQNVTDLLFARGIDIGIVQTDVLASLKRKAPFPGFEDFLQYITRLYDQEIHILAGSNIHSLNDLEDKRVNFGTPESGTYSTASTIFRALGVPVQTTFFPQPLALNKLRRGEISAVVYIAGKPARLLQGVRPEEALDFLTIPTTEALAAGYTP